MAAGASTTAVFAFLLGTVAGTFSAGATVQSPQASAAENSSTTSYTASSSENHVQSLVVSDNTDMRDVVHDGYTVEVEAPPPPPPPPQNSAPEWASVAPPPDPASAKGYAKTRLANMGMGNDQYSCLVALWQRESHWNAYAENPYSGAYGIPQALPGSKMASAGADWRTNAKTQINWGLGYIQNRYGSPCGAWSHSQNAGWY